MLENVIAGNWTSQVITLLERLQETQSKAIAEAAEWSAEAIAGDGFVHMFGSGHSRIAVEEMFPRYGSFPGFNPMVELSTTFHTQIVGSNGQRQAMFIENISGLAESILANFAFRRSDVMLVFSVSGTSAVAVELTQIAQKRGLKTIAVTSVAHSESSESRTGIRLKDVADLVIDIGTPPGDALVDIPGLEFRVGPGSTVLTAAVANEIKVQTAEKLVRRGIHPPVLTGSMVVGSERSAQLFDAAYDDHARRLAYALGSVGEIREEINAQRPTR
jgi:uncharacterized phosphosugar-binding protein